MIDFEKQIEQIQKDMLRLEKLWEIKKFKPNPQQEKAILHVDGPLLITAGPGSGKTRVLLWRTVNLIVFHDVKPEEIFLSTFTEKAAHQLKEGLQDLLSIVTNINGQPYDLAQMYIGTVHSLCQRILNDRWRFDGNNEKCVSPNLLDALGQYFHISRRNNWDRISAAASADSAVNQNLQVNRLFGDEMMAKHQAVQNCIRFFNRASEECINAKDAIKKLQDPDETIADHFRQYDINRENLQKIFEMYAVYQETLQPNERARYTDFSLLQQEAFRLLDNGEGNGFKHIIIDEYQDTNTIQERIFFKLAEESHNLCVVGDDDQALYRFRGATVENFVDFPRRCRQYLKKDPARIPLELNYRSRKRIVDFYTEFMQQIDWRGPDDRSYRVENKTIDAFRVDEKLSAVASSAKKPEAVCKEIAELVRGLVASGKVEDPNQVAFLFPSLKSVQVGRMEDALEEVGLKVYAPRAGIFLEVDEVQEMLGLIAMILGLPEMEGGYGGDYAHFCSWTEYIERTAKDLCREDPQLKAYVNAKQEEVSRVCGDYIALKRVVESEGWEMTAPFDTTRMKRKLYNARRFSDEGKKLLSSTHLERLLKIREQEGNPFPLSYIVKRVTSLDWSVLDLFYRLCGFDHFKAMFDLAECGTDEGPICNLSLLSQYLARFVESFMPMLTADLITDGIFHRVFYFSYLFALYRLGESEYEDAEDPFPRGRIPFLTIHQAKGLEFPVVVLGNLSRRSRPPDFVEVATRPFSQNQEGEPLDRQDEFDTARMFYVALSRAQNLLVVADYKGRPKSEPFKNLLDDNFKRIPELEVESIPSYSETKEALPKMYSYTSDFLQFKKCPRQYMIFRKYGFVPSRAQTMYFGSLVHRTLEDLHHEVIRRRGEKA